MQGTARPVSPGGCGAGTWQTSQTTPTRDQLGSGPWPDSQERTQETPSAPCRKGWWLWAAQVPS